MLFNGKDCIYHEYVYLNISANCKLNVSEWVNIHMSKARLMIKDSSSEVKFSYASHKKVRLENLISLTQQLHSEFPQIEISPIDIFQIQRISTSSELSIAKILRLFFEAGARILDGRHPTDLDIEMIMGFHETAHRIGYRSHLFLVFKPKQELEKWFSYLNIARELQSKYQGFLSFTPVPRKHFQSAYDTSDVKKELKILSLSRIFLNNINFIQAPISRYGISLSQLAICYGANTIRGRISDSPNSRFVRCNDLKTINRAEITSLMGKAQKSPKESNAFLHYAATSKFKEKRNNDNFKSVSMLLYKLEHGGQLSNDEYLNLLKYCPVNKLAMTAKVRADKLKGGNSYIRFNDKMGDTKYKNAFFGITTLLEDPSQIDSQLNSSIDFVIPNHKDKFGSITNTEIAELHRKLAESGFKSFGKIEITATFHGDGEPFWKLFLRKLEFYESLALELGSMIEGVTISRSRGSYLTPVEFLKGLAVARLKLSEQVKIYVPIENIPHLLRLENKSDRIKEQLRLSPLCLEFGANHLIIRNR